MGAEREAEVAGVTQDRLSLALRPVVIPIHPNEYGFRSFYPVHGGCIWSY